jgi:PAS domain S-box-containing protein
MDKRSFQRLLRRTVALPVILLVLLAATLAGEILLLSTTQHWVDHSDQVISNARELMRDMVEMDTGLHGYHLTRDKSFLETYQDAHSRFPDQLEVLQRLTSDNPNQQRLLHQIRDLDFQWMAGAEAQLGRQDGTPTQDDQLSGQQLMTNIRAKQREFIGAEETLRRLRSHRVTALNTAVIASAAGLTLLIAVLLFTLTRRELMALSSTYERHLEAEVDQQRQLKESREWFQITLKSLGEAVVSTDQTGKVSFINPVAQQLTGWSYAAAQGRPFEEVVRINDERSRTDVEDPIKAVRRAQKVVGFSNSLILTSRSGKEYPIELTGAPILNDRSEVVGVAVVFRDVTQRRQTEQTLRTSERLTLAGRLSATIAHEIRNPLDTVTNLIYLLQHEQKPGPVSGQYLQMASDELARISQITGQLLTFHREARNPIQVNLTEVLQSVLVLFAPQIKQNHITVQTRFDTDRSVRGFPGELRQVFSNLVGNAVEAMLEGGELILHTQESTLASDPSRRGVRITIVDNGTGIPMGVRKNLFAPFYTTKGEKGTGLGLWVSRGIIEKHEGTIHLSSRLRPDRCGTAFSVFLPFEQKLGLLDAHPSPRETSDND